MDARALRYLSAADVAACLPAGRERVELAARALRALATDAAEMPAKIGVHPRPGTLLHAMPAWLRGEDVVGMKWVALFPDNKRHGLPSISGLVVLNDPDTGLPIWIVDAAVITAHRTAAVSGVAISLFAPPSVGRVCIVGAGVQARSHFELIAELVPGARVILHDRHPERAGALAEQLARARGAKVEAVDDVRAAVAGSQVVVTAASLQKDGAFIEPDWLADGALVVAVDFATSVRASVARAARHFVSDDRGQYLAYREGGYFDGYPADVETLGELLERRGLVAEEPADDRPVLVSHLGVGLADVVFAEAIARQAERRGAGTVLPR